MKRSLLLVTYLISYSALAEDSWVSLPASPSAAPVISADSDIVDNSQVRQLPSQERAINQSGLISELLMQLEQMQQELSELRELVEQNKQSLSQTVKTQQQRYLDVDRRLSSLTQKLLLDPVNATTLPTETLESTSSKDSVKVSFEGVEASYQSAMTQLRDKDFAAASQSFKTFTERYIGHPLVVNALYWQAEVHLVEQQLESAAVLFQRVLDNYPDHSKAADAAYKLAVTLDRQGNSVQARRQLEAVIQQYQEKSPSTVKLAERYLEKL